MDTWEVNGKSALLLKSDYSTLALHAFRQLAKTSQ